MVNKISICRTCKNEFKYRTGSSKGYYCCLKCRDNDKNRQNPMKGKKRNDLSEYNKKIKPLMIGNLNSNWKNGITNENRKLRSIKESKQWRKDVLKRDNNQCRFCLSKNNLEVHHIVPVREFIKNYPEVIFERENGITLCINCHSKIDKFRGKFNG